MVAPEVQNLTDQQHLVLSPSHASSVPWVLCLAHGASPLMRMHRATSAWHSSHISAARRILIFGLHYNVTSELCSYQGTLDTAIYSPRQKWQAIDVFLGLRGGSSSDVSVSDFFLRF